MIRVVAIDGPAGSGKSTVARGVGDALGLEVLDTGAMYRAVTLLALERGLDLRDGDAIARAAEQATLELGDPPGSVRLDGRDVSRDIRGPAVSAEVSAVTRNPRSVPRTSPRCVMKSSGATPSTTRRHRSSPRPTQS